ncbi:MAG TPA: hypothetical protein DDW52_16550 [Planctomycetaceae bacterium]|nr:hypothetical protein [Planctomycetaceae bacterium]
MTLTKERDRDPLIDVPTSAAVRLRLHRVLQEAKKLRILLRTASQIERIDSAKLEGRTDG